MANSKAISFDAQVELEKAERDVLEATEATAIHNAFFRALWIKTHKTEPKDIPSLEKLLSEWYKHTKEDRRIWFYDCVEQIFNPLSDNDQTIKSTMWFYLVDAIPVYMRREPQIISVDLKERRETAVKYAHECWLECRKLELKPDHPLKQIVMAWINPTHKDYNRPMPAAIIKGNLGSVRLIDFHSDYNEFADIPVWDRMKRPDQQLSMVFPDDPTLAEHIRPATALLIADALKLQKHTKDGAVAFVSRLFMEGIMAMHGHTLMKIDFRWGDVINYFYPYWVRERGKKEPYQRRPRPAQVQSICDAFRALRFSGGVKCWNEREGELIRFPITPIEIPTVNTKDDAIISMIGNIPSEGLNGPHGAKTDSPRTGITPWLCWGMDSVSCLLYFVG